MRLRSSPSDRRPLILAAGVLVTIAALAAIVLLIRPGAAPEPGAGGDAGPPVATGPLAPLARNDAGPPPDAARPPSPWKESAGTLQKAQTVTAALQAHGVTAGQVHEIVTALSGVYDFKRARPGAAYSLKLRREDGRLERFTFEHGALEQFEVVRKDDATLEGRQIAITQAVVEAEVGAEISDSLYLTMKRAGESAALVSLIVDVFAWDIDFFKDTRRGDRFRVVVEKIYKDGAGGERQFVRYGKILAAEYSGKVGTFRIFWFAPEPGKPGDYYLADGRSARKTFLATPLKFVRISSHFNKARKHPILGYTRAHLGTDYAAPTGTPVMAMANGTVTFAGRNRGYGNYVVIRHDGGLVSSYAHLHRIAKGIKPGAKVVQKQVIGAVGTTGLSTGPHLHFGVQLNGRFVNPIGLKMSRERPVDKKHKKAFEAVAAEQVARLARVAVVAAPADEQGDDVSTDEGAAEPALSDDVDVGLSVTPP